MSHRKPQLGLSYSPALDDLTEDGLRQWMRDHRVDEVECVIGDFPGQMRGKVMPAAKFARFNPIHLPISIFYQTVTGKYIEYDSDAYETEIDMVMAPDLSTVRAAPWANDPSLQVIHDAVDRSGRPIPVAPRNILKRVLALYENDGMRPVVAPELEFYLTRRNTDPDYPIEPPKGRSGRSGVGNQAYSIAAVDEYESVIEHIYDFADAQGLEIDTVIQEAGPAQLEINLHHGDPLDLADQIFVFKRTIREAALRHDCYATFMAMPMAEQPGSAMHIHQSIVDARTGANVFSEADGSASPRFGWFIGGQQQYLGAATCILAPYVNSYRRFIPDLAAPINLQWGEDNRTVGLRSPIAPAEARRIETRIVGADANPYLAFAACLACGWLGMRDQITPREPISGSAYQEEYGLPRGLLEAVSLFEDCPPLREILGEPFCDVYAAVKRHEFEEYMRVISPWEREHLLLNV